MSQYLYVQNFGNQLFIKEIDTVTKHRSTNVTGQSFLRLFIPAKKTGEEPLFDFKSNFKTVKGEELKEVQFNTVKKFKEALKMFDDYGQKCYGMKQPTYQHIREQYNTEKADVNNVLTAYFDIETARDEFKGYSPANEAENEILSISLVTSDENRLHYWATKDLSNEFIDEHDFVFHWFMTEHEMINHFINWVREKQIDILTGWNVEIYDVPYLITRCKVLGINEKQISPFNRVYDQTVKNQFGGTELTYNIIGIAILDYINLYKRFTYVVQEQYTLNHIAYVELKEKKVDYSEERNLQELYDNNFEKFTEYNLKDSMLVKRLNNKLKLIELAISLAYKAGCNFQDTLGTVKIWTVFFYQEMIKENIIPPMFNSLMDSADIVGGFVKVPIVGKFDWVLSFDLASLYPHNQMGMNISFEKILEDTQLSDELIELRSSIWEKYKTIENIIEALVNKEIDLSCLKRYNVGMTPNVQFFSNEGMGIAPKILKQVYTERKEKRSLQLQKKQELEDLKNKYSHFEEKV